VALPEDAGILMSSFESIGVDCEFGFVQRHFGIEPLGLLRFAGTGFLSNLLRLFETDFAGLGDPGSLTASARDTEIYRPGDTPLVVNEYFIHDDKLIFSFHTWRGPADVSEEQSRAENETKLRFLKRKLLEELEDGEKIWLLKTTGGAEVYEAFAFHSVINRKARNKLFWVTRSVEGRPSGSVEWLGRDILRGYSDHDHHDAQIFNADTWLQLCQNAWRAFAECTDMPSLQTADPTSAEPPGVSGSGEQSKPVEPSRLQTALTQFFRRRHE
jgi:hypothetical protein